ncbi:MAG: nucleotidyltransferase domain-containing protein [Gammaproteobacteria bacterium]|nr:nucleotidyltransferase domain-containing protein [Gammaproteobacteria bacterium]CAJ2376426.1 MAG: hypothetical protein IBGAMO2_340010 [Arenicellales bacterium IbO2]MDA7961824.1 nucleotidyltransferase domain-containing protein [Gammaproteobacteria bacterium]MDA7970768.1 nucleotidyltransferase domain-containing protein [Gammaproteobacteria bacterium]MDA7995931.1 nucleotidyltransferase domain-containing protein [Gammaproteobacteria bacterium]
MQTTAVRKIATAKQRDDAPPFLAPILRRFPQTQAVYLFGTYGSKYHMPESDIDLGVLLPEGDPEILAQGMQFGAYEMIHHEVADAAKVEYADLFNMRHPKMPADMRYEIVKPHHRLYCANAEAARAFEAAAANGNVHR